MENKFVTLGCRLNTFESEVIKEELQKNNIKDKIIINTCSVTEKAEKDSLRQIKKLKKLYPNKDIVVTGCAVHTALDKIKSMPEVTQIVENSNKLTATAFVKKINSIDKTINIDKNNSFTTVANTNQGKMHNTYNIPVLSHFNNRTRGFVQIQQGCDHRCSFCIINKTRGESISLEQTAIINQVNTLVNNGYKEITLTGVDISSWQRNIFNEAKSKLGNLCYSILKAVPNLKRLRLSSLDPAVEDDTLLDLLHNEERFMPHLHLSLQSMNNNVLNNMGRRHSKESAIVWINKLKSANSNLVLGADIICGFPRETEEHFLDTHNTLKELNVPLLHVFPYSERSGTPAAKMEQLPQYIRKERALKLIDLANSLKKQFFNSKLGKIEEVLIENNNLGHTKDYSQVKVTNKPVEKNSLIQILIVNSSDSSLIGETINV